MSQPHRQRPKQKPKYDDRARALDALKADSERQMTDLIRRRLALPIVKRTHFLRVRLPGGGSSL